MQSQIVCHGCRSVLLYPRGAPTVCCAVCHAVTNAPPSDLSREMERRTQDLRQERQRLLGKRFARQKCSRGAAGSSGGTSSKRLRTSSRERGEGSISGPLLILWEAYSIERATTGKRTSGEESEEEKDEIPLALHRRRLLTASAVHASEELSSHLLAKVTTSVIEARSEASAELVARRSSSPTDFNVASVPKTTAAKKLAVVQEDAPPVVSATPEVVRLSPIKGGPDMGMEALPFLRGGRQEWEGGGGEAPATSVGRLPPQGSTSGTRFQAWVWIRDSMSDAPVTSVEAIIPPSEEVASKICLALTAKESLQVTTKGVLKVAQVEKADAAAPKAGIDAWADLSGIPVAQEGASSGTLPSLGLDVDSLGELAADFTQLAVKAMAKGAGVVQLEISQLRQEKILLKSSLVDRERLEGIAASRISLLEEELRETRRELDEALSTISAQRDQVGLLTKAQEDLRVAHAA